MLDKDALDNLLLALHADREQASHSYQALRERLIRFFQWNRADMPEELADEVLDRLGRRLTCPPEPIQDPVHYAAGIARLLLQEHRRQNIRQDKAVAAMAQSSLAASRIEQERALEQERAELLQQCLDAIPTESRDLIRGYYSTEGQADRRQAMADHYGISINALRNRAYAHPQ